MTPSPSSEHPSRSANSIASALGIDVGGTRIKAGRASSSGEVLLERSVATPADARELEEALVLLARELGAASGADHSIGIGVPGLIDPERGWVAASPNVPQLERLPLRDILARALAAVGTREPRVVVENDANAAALGELWLGAARGEDNVLVVTLGTGIGGGLVLAGELFRGEGLAGEIGHVRIDPNGPLCGCGGRGCLETLASATAARERALERGLPAHDPGNLELLAERARLGFPDEARLLFDVGHDLGIGLSTAVCLLDLRAFVIGGGFAGALDGLLPGIRAGIRAGAYGERVDAIRIARASLGERAGWIGAARLALDART